MGDISIMLLNLDNELTVAHKLLNSIKTKLRKNKLIMWGTLGFLALVLALVLYSYFKSPSNSTTTVIQSSGSRWSIIFVINTNYDCSLNIFCEMP